MKVEEDNVEAVIDKYIKDGRVIGLSKWEGKKVKVLILKED